MRVFVAVPARADGPFAELAERLAGLEGRVKPVPPQNAHVTLKFLGDVAEPAVPQVAAAVRDAVAVSGVRRFEATLVGVGAFPRESHPRVVWVGVDDDGAAKVKRLAESVETSLAGLGYARERRDFHAHVTIARVESLRDPRAFHDLLEPYRRVAFGTLDGTVAKVMRSTLTPSGAVYETVHEVPLP